MNHLAHLFLGSGSTIESLIGNIAGDFVKGPLRDRFTDGIRAGIMQHRRIDSFTDTHPVVASFRRVMTDDYGHYSRVIADVFFDHFLACDFERYGNESLQSFLDRTFATLDPHMAEMPERLRSVYPHMKDGWLLSYRETDAIREALHFMARRFSRHPHLQSATDLLMTKRAELLSYFHAFMPDVIAFAGTLRS